MSMNFKQFNEYVSYIQQPNIRLPKNKKNQGSKFVIHFCRLQTQFQSFWNVNHL